MKKGPVTEAVLTLVLCAASAHVGKDAPPSRTLSYGLAILTKTLVILSKDMGFNADQVASVVLATWDDVLGEVNEGVVAANSKGGVG